MTAFVTDTFTDTNGTSVASHSGELGATWVKHGTANNSGNSQITSNKLVTTENAVNENYYASGAPAAADYSVSLDYTYNNSANNEIAGPAARMSASAATGYFFIYFKNAVEVRLYKNVAGSLSQIGSGVGFVPTNGAAYRLTIDVSGTTIAGRLQRLSDSHWLQTNGTFSASQVNCISTTDSGITAAGKAGFWFSGDLGGGGARGTIDNFSADEAGGGGATSVTMSGPTTGTTGVASTNFTIGADGAITGTVVVTPSDGGDGGTFAPTSVSISSGTPTATFTYTAASNGAKTISVSNNGGLANPSNITYTASSAAATTTIVTGPSGGVVSVASTNFTASADGTITGTVVITPSDGGAGGTFTPTTVSISSGTPTATFTYTPSSTGAKTISFTNNGGLANQSNLTYTATAASVTINVTDANLFFSPYNWYSDGGGAMAANNVKGSSTYAQSNNPGAYMKFKVTLTQTGDVVMNVNNAHLSGVSAGDFPQIAVYRDSGAPSLIQLSGTSPQAITLASGLGAGTYQFVVMFKAVGISGADRWNTPAQSIKVISLTAPGGSTLATPVLRSRNILVPGDSIDEGVHNLGTSTAVADQDAGYTWAHFIAAALDAEVGIVGFGGQGWNDDAIGNVPDFEDSWDFYSSGRSRLVSGALSPVPDLVIVAHGENDTPGATVQTAITNTLAAIRAATTARIVVCVPFSGDIRADINAATLPSNTDIIDVNANGGDGSHLLYYTGYQTPLHPDIKGSAYIACRLAKLIERGGIKSAQSITITLTSDGTTPIASLTGLKWAWWDKVTPDRMGPPTDSGTVETTNGSGVLTIPIRSVLTSGGIGWLTVTNSDGTTSQSPAHKAFSGPVAVT